MASRQTGVGRYTRCGAMSGSVLPDAVHARADRIDCHSLIRKTAQETIAVRASRPAPSRATSPKHPPAGHSVMDWRDNLIRWAGDDRACSDPLRPCTSCPVSPVLPQARKSEQRRVARHDDIGRLRPDVPFPFVNPLAGTRQRRSANASRNAGMAATVSRRALLVLPYKS